MTDYLEILNNMTPEEIQRIAQEANAALAGVKFIPNPGPQTDAYFSKADILLYGGSAGCVSGDTEYLSSSGWKRIDEYSGDEIAEYREDGKVYWSLPVDYINAPCSELIKFSTGRSSMVLSDCHNMLLYDYEGKAVVKKAADVAKKPSRYKVPINYTVSTNGVPFDEMTLRLAVAIHADGNLTFRQDGGAYCRISLRKQRKIDRLLWLFSQLGITPHEYRNANRPTEVRYGFESPVLTKKYDGAWWGASQDQLEVILDEMSYWDGAYSGAIGGDICYNTAIKNDADFIQYAAHACGRVATISVRKSKNENHSDLYRVHITKAKSAKGSISLRGDSTKIERVKADRMYCFTTSSGFWLARHNGCIFITGNSGKSGLILGLALSQHDKSLILRPSYTDLYALTEDAVRLNGTRDGFTGGTRPRLKTSDGRNIEFGAVGDNVDSWKGQPHDLLAYDELTDFREADFRFLQTWVRSVKKGQRTRVIGATNPPTSSTGDWVIGYWRPWLDPTYEKPAKHGELRWCVTDPDGKDMWVDGPEPILFPGETTPSKPKSRTFIPGKLSDNPYLKDTDYKSTLDALSEPLRSAMRDGNFMMARTDQENQVIPLQWIRMAQARWAERAKEKRARMSALGCDPSCGGIDDTVLAPLREDLFFENLQTKPGKEMKEGSDVAAFAVKNLRDGAVVGMDMGGGYGGAPKVHLADSGIKVLGYKGSMATTALDATKTLGFVSLAAESLWRVREALDPEHDPTMALPDDPLMVSELCAYTFETVRQDNRLKIKITTKEDVKKAIGRSPGRGDAIRIAYWAHLKREKERVNSVLYGKSGGGKLKVNLGHEGAKKRRRR